MNCMYPITILQTKGVDEGKRIPVPCGKCMACLQKKRSHWSFRIEQEFKRCSSAFFITLTYDDEKIPRIRDKTGFYINTLSKIDVQLFLKRLRADLDKLREKYQLVSGMSQNECKVPKIRYYAVGEYGSITNRPHYHIIIFNLPNLPRGSNGNNDKLHDIIYDNWKKGHIKIGSVTPASIAYVTKYLITASDNYAEGQMKPFNLMSRKPGLGIDYIEEKKEWHLKTKNNYTIKNENKISLPRYYRDRIFNNSERKVQNAINKKLYEKKEKENDEELRRFGQDPLKYEIEQKKQITKELKKKLTKNQKL